MNTQPAAALAIVLAALSAGASAQDARAEDRTRHDTHGGSVRQGAREAGHSFHQGLRKTGHAIHEGVKATGHAIHQGVKATGHAIHEGVDKVAGK